MMRTIETTAIVNPDGTVKIQVPAEILPGKHRIVLVIDEQLESNALSSAEIDAALVEMASDPDYQAEALQIEAEFATAQWEAFLQTPTEL